MKPLVAPTIFIMAISSRRSKVVSLMVLAMMNTDTRNRMAIRATLMMVAMLRMVMKPSLSSSYALTFPSPMPGTSSIKSAVSDIRDRSSI